MTNGTAGSGTDIAFDNLYSAILRCFVVILAGYIAGRTGHITSTQGRGIAAFISTFCLPALLFRAMCTLDFSQVNWYFLLSIFISKTTIFILVSVITVLVKRPVNFGLCGIFGIFCTQSNDFAFGYPILQALYQKTEPEFLDYIYLIAPISILFLNPIGFFFMEYHRQRSQCPVTSSCDEIGNSQKREHTDGIRSYDEIGNSQKREHTDSIRSNRSVHTDSIRSNRSVHTDSIRSNRSVYTDSIRSNSSIHADSIRGNNSLGKSGNSWYGDGTRSTSQTSCVKRLAKVAKGVLINPIVFMSVIGIIGNFILHKKIPDVLDDILVVLGNAFSASALFYLGLTMVGKMKSQIGVMLIVPVLLIFAKSLLLPIITWEVVSWLEPNETQSISLSMFGFFYSTIPTAPSVLLFAVQYGVADQLVATGVVAGTFLSAPLMFVSAKMMTMVVSHDKDHHSLLLDTCIGTSIVSIACCVWVSLCLVLSGRWRRVPHRFTLCVIASQMLECIGRLSMEDVAHFDGRHYAQWFTLIVGVFSSRCWAAALALVLCMLHTHGLCFVLRHQFWFYFLGFGFPVLMSGLLLLIGSEDVLNQYNPSGQMSVSQTVISSIVLSTSLSISLVSMVVWQRYVWHDSSGPRYTPNPSSSPGVKKESSTEPLIKATDELMINSDRATPSPIKHVNYQSCAATDACASNSREDIVLFPESPEIPGSSAKVEGADREVRRKASYASVSANERMCLAHHCSRAERKACSHILKSYMQCIEKSVDSPQDEGTQNARELLKKEYQSVQHLLLIILLTASTCVCLLLSVWRAFSDNVSGTYLEIEFLDSVLNYGQGFLTFVVFGFDVRMIFTPVLRRVRRLLYGTEEVHLPDISELDEKTETTCLQFLTFHRQKCRKQICRDARFQTRHYKGVFTGVELCDWLIEAGLTSDKEGAVIYGRRLLEGRIIASVTRLHHFEYSPLFYVFVHADSGD